jgi:alpha-L-fucosidase
MKKLWLSVVCAMLWLAVGRAESPAERAERMQWWREARFGMFIHWGLYAQLAGSYDGKEIDNNGEWIMDRAMIPVAKYAAVAKEFNPVKFDAAEWVRIVKRAGMKYIVITAKHHDGFAMYPSKVSPFNLHDATPFKRDPLAELAEACRREGLRFGLYYSQAMDWHHPGGQPPNRGWWDAAQHGDMTNYIHTIAVPQVRELCSNYGPLAEIWWDMPRNMTPEFAEKLHAVVRELQPQALMNNRLGGGVKGDMETPEQFIPSTGGPEGRDWETCMTMNNTWGFKKQDTDWKSTEDLLRKLLDICHKGGNFLLNVGPTAEGVIPPASVERLAAIGRWLEKNGAAVYGTTASPLPFLSWGRCTRKGHTLFLHVFDWPANGELRVPMQAKVTGACLLAKPDQPLTHTLRDGAVVVRLPTDRPDQTDPTDRIATVIKLTLADEPVVMPPLTRKKPARASFGDASRAFDGSAGRAWEAKKGDKSGWLEVDLGAPTAVAALAFDEPHRGAGKRGQKFRLQVQGGADWKEIITGATKGYGTTQLFPAVTGQVFRLEIFESKDTAAVAEWQLYRPE